MIRISKQDRQRIVDDFIERYGHYDARAFVEEVRASNGQHPAWTWFTWDDERAAEDYRVWEAQKFTHGLKINFSIEVLERGKVRVRTAEAPMVFSPVETRRDNGGYIRLDPADPENMGMFCVEAAQALRAWMDRYEGAVMYASGSVSSFGKLIGTLEAKEVAKEEAA